MNQHTHLECRTANHNKQYHVFLEAEGQGFIVYATYGPIGGTLQKTVKTNSPVSLTEARKTFDKLVNEKLAKGYAAQMGVSASGKVSGQSTREQTGILPVLLEEVDSQDQLNLLLRNSDHGMQEKKDGRRLLIEGKRHPSLSVHGINRKGQVTELAQEIAESALVLLTEEESFLLDGEAMGDTFWAFDLLELNGQNWRDKAYIDRYLELRFILGKSTQALRLVEMSSSQSAKENLFARYQADGLEGVVFKRLESPYSEPQLKWKFWAEADCIVAAGKPNKRSVGLEVYQGTNRRFIGNVTIPANYDIPPVGAVVKTKYLYATKAGILYQPQYQGERDDKAAKDCFFSQLKFKNNESEDSDEN